MAQTTYQVTLSVDGNHSVTVATDNQEESRLAIAWAKSIFDQLVNRHNQNAQKLPAEIVYNGKQQEPTCAVHKVPMVRVQGRKGEFWSCHQKNEDGSWCSYRPKDE